MLGSCPSLRSVTPQVIAPQPILALSLELESAHRSGVLLMLLLVLVLVLVLPLICPVNFLLHLTTLWLMHLLQFLILSLFFYFCFCPCHCANCFCSCCCLISVCAAPASVNDAPTTVPAVATVATVAPTVPKMPAVLLPQFSSNPEIVEKKLRGYIKKLITNQVKGAAVATL